MYSKKLRGQKFSVTFDYLLHHNQPHLNSLPASCLQSTISVYSVETNGTNGQTFTCNGLLKYTRWSEMGMRKKVKVCQSVSQKMHFIPIS